jgi:transposase
MNENTAKEPAISTPPAGIVRVGVDLAKRSIQVHGVDASGKVLINRALSRQRFLPWCAQLPPGCTVAMEACGGAHHWARELAARGLTPKIIPAALVSPYRIQGASGKNDANDAAAICEAASRPQMRFVLPKSAQQQSMLCIHRLREGFKSDRTACINRIRGLLSEFGLVFAQGSKALRQEVMLALEDASNPLPGLARLGIAQACEHWRHLDEQMLWCDQRIAAHTQEDPQVNAAMQIIGIGPITASAAVATVGDFKQFNSGAQFGAWLGLVPRQHSSGGKASLGRITKRGDTYLRMLLIQAAKSAVLTAHRRQDTLSQWMLKLRESRGWQRAAVALANKNARILWAILSKAASYDPMHVSIKPAAAVSAQ